MLLASTYDSTLNNKLNFRVSPLNIATSKSYAAKVGKNVGRQDGSKKWERKSTGATDKHEVNSEKINWKIRSTELAQRSSRRGLLGS